ncbi:MAG: acyltransferase family protein, partial [Phycisphaera sp.]|nr:acyltransferase family protein [Phycisphaera sp.]
MPRDLPDPRHRPDPRHHGLDYLRGLMIIVVVVAHVVMQYQTMPAVEDLASIEVIGETYRDPDRTIVADRIHQVARGSVNPMLFLLAGFSWAFLLKRKSLRSITVSRTTRILIPMVVGWLIAFPLLRYAFA